ncbi:hypothetical protein H0E87_000230 [Populus deltoides]|uniref:Uncharacterized protein n=1 Tax=Populus deltoides TaxID=3696 RepID=A0A8T2ZLP6_POPDE|nr:hypothetical protein H0E87_000230 [Populus deltoides]
MGLKEVKNAVNPFGFTPYGTHLLGGVFRDLQMDGDSQALPRGTSSSKLDCFASYRLSSVNLPDDSTTIHRDSWHRFSSKKKSHGLCDFTAASTVFDSKLG